MGHYGIHRSDQCLADNDRLARTAAQAPDRIIPIGTCWPQSGKAGVDEAGRCIQELGHRGLKFHPWLQGFSLSDTVFGAVCDLAGELGVPIILHDGTPCYSLPEQVGGLARRFPRTRFVLGHAGLLWNWRSAAEAAQLPNVWICLCGPHMRAIERLCQKVDPERLLWGTDFGFSFADSIGYRLDLILRAKISDSLRERILRLNPQHLLDA
jgi:predicted TIM-barrel fold metal-dependent hydrolase